MARKTKDWNWYIDVDEDNKAEKMDAHLSVLMDIRDELKSINLSILTGIKVLRTISRNTYKKRKRK